MTYSDEHVYVDEGDFTDIVVQGGVAHAQYSRSGELPIRHPGQLTVSVQAIYYTVTGIQPPSPTAPQAHAGTARAVDVDAHLFARRQSVHRGPGDARGSRALPRSPRSLAGNVAIRNIRRRAHRSTVGPPAFRLLEGTATVRIAHRGNHHIAQRRPAGVELRRHLDDASLLVRSLSRRPVRRRGPICPAARSVPPRCFG